MTDLALPYLVQICSTEENDDFPMRIGQFGTLPEALEAADDVVGTSHGDSVVATALIRFSVLLMFSGIGGFVYQLKYLYDQYGDDPTR